MSTNFNHVQPVLKQVASRVFSIEIEHSLQILHPNLKKAIYVLLASISLTDILFSWSNFALFKFNPLLHSASFYGGKKHPIKLDSKGIHKPGNIRN